MKNYIYKIQLVIIAILTLNSCTVDNDDPVMNSIGNIEASFTSRVYRAPANATSYDLEVNVSSILPKSAQIDFSFDDGLTGVARGNQGSNTIVISVDMSAHTFRTIRLIDIILLYASAHNTEIKVSEINNVATIVKGDDTIALLSWNTTNDIDLILTEAPAPSAPYSALNPGTIDYSISVTPGESVVLPATVQDGHYAISIVPWDTLTGPVDFTMEVFAGTEAYLFTATLNSGGPGQFGLLYNTVDEFVRVSKETVSGTPPVVNYTVTNQL